MSKLAGFFSERNRDFMNNSVHLLLALIIPILFAACSGGGAPGPDAAASAGVGSAPVPIPTISSITIDNISPTYILPTSGTATFRATAIGTDGSPAAGVTLSSATTGSADLSATSPATGITNSSGQVTFTVTDDVAENIVIRIFNGAISREQNFMFGATLVLTPAAVTASGQTTLTAYLRDANSVGIPNTTVSFIPDYSDNDNLLSPASAVTDSNGAVEVTATDRGNNGGTVGVTAQTVSLGISASSLVTFQTETASLGVTATATFLALDTGDSSTIQATVTNLDTGVPVEGQPVTITAGGSAIITPAGPYTTDVTGKVTVAVTDAVAENVLVSVKSGQQVDIPLYFGSSLKFTPTSSQSTADGQDTTTLKATLGDFGNVRIPNVPVYFQVVTPNDAMLNIGSSLTNSQGEAFVEVTNSKIETTTVRATCGALAAQPATITYRAGDAANMTLSSSPTNSSALSLFGQAVITANITDLLGNPVSDNTAVSFAVSGTARNAKITPSATTIGGEATASLSAEDVSGSLSVTATTGAISKSMNFTVAPSNAGQVQVYSVVPPTVSHLGQPGTQTSIITFSVKDPGGNYVADGTPVDISLDPLQLGGGELLSDGTNPFATQVTKNTVAGLASVTFRAGIVAGTVDVTASVASPLGADISTVASVTITSGSPDSLHLPVGGTPLNVPSLIYKDCPSAYSITVGDRYGNPVPDGTQVSFMVEPGCAIIGDSAQGFTKTTTKGVIDETVTHSTDWLFPNPPESDIPHCMVVAYMPGDEGYQDNNGNGVFDAGDVCSGDQGEPYIDADESGSYNLGELYIDVDQDNVYDPKDGVCKTHTTIWRPIEYLMSGNMTNFTVVPGSFTLYKGESETFTVTVSDANGAPPVAGTELSVATTAGTLVGGGTDIMADTADAVPLTKVFALISPLNLAGGPTEAVISVALKYPGDHCANNGANTTLEIFGIINQVDSSNLGSVTATVTKSADGAPISGAIVTLSPNSTCTTNALGSCSFAEVPAGTKQITATATGYTQSTPVNITVTGGNNTPVAISLAP